MTTRRPPLALLALAVLLGWPASRAAAADRTTLAVAAASSLRLAAERLERAFEAARPDVDVTFAFGASGTLFAQLRDGAPYDVFLSADREYPARLVAERLGADETVYALGRLVVWVPPGSPIDLERSGLAALADPRVRRIAMANPAVAPFGRAAERALQAAGVHDAVKGKLVLGTSVAQAAQFATTGAADAALLPASLVLSEALAAGRAVPVPDALAPPVEHSGVAVSASRSPGLARAFLAFVAGPEGRAILARTGYGLP